MDSYHEPRYLHEKLALCAENVMAIGGLITTIETGEVSPLKRVRITDLLTLEVDLLNKLVLTVRDLAKAIEAWIDVDDEERTTKVLEHLTTTHLSIAAIERYLHELQER